MRKRCKITVGPDALPISLARVKEHVRVDGTGDDNLLTLYLAAAVSQAESITNRQLLQATRTLTLDQFPDSGEAIELPYPPLQSVSSVSYVDVNGDTQTLVPGDDYTLDNASDVTPALLWPVDSDWPATKSDTPAAVTIVYVCGWTQSGSPAVADLPEAVEQWLLLRAAGLYGQRENVAMGNPHEFKQLPRTFVDALLDPWIVPGGV